MKYDVKHCKHTKNDFIQMNDVYLDKITASIQHVIVLMTDSNISWTN